MISRRRFNQYLATGLLTAGLTGRNLAASQPPRKLRAGAIQMTPKLGRVAANLEQAEKLILEAQGMGAEWIALPEMFTSAAAFHPDLLSAIRDLDGESARFMKRLARQGKCVIGGSCWWTLPGEVDIENPLRTTNLHMLQQAPVRFARLLGVPEIGIPGQPSPRDPIPQRFWLPDEMPEPWKDSWWRWLGNGPRYHRSVTQPFVRTGQIAEYQPEYMQ